VQHTLSRIVRRAHRAYIVIPRGASPLP
jgi:hypothetical protein